MFDELGPASYTVHSEMYSFGILIGEVLNGESGHVPWKGTCNSSLQYSYLTHSVYYYTIGDIIVYLSN